MPRRSGLRTRSAPAHVRSAHAERTGERVRAAPNQPGNALFQASRAPLAAADDKDSRTKPRAIEHRLASRSRVEDSKTPETPEKRARLAPARADTKDRLVVPLAARSEHRVTCVPSPAPSQATCECTTHAGRAPSAPHQHNNPESRALSDPRSSARLNLAGPPSHFCRALTHEGLVV